MLETEVRSLSKVFIVVDALDECIEIDDKCRLLCELQKLLPTARLLITSRPHIADIDHHFQDFARLEVRASDEDIEAYIREQIATQRRLKRSVQNDETFKDDIVGTIVGKAQGM